MQILPGLEKAKDKLSPAERSVCECILGAPEAAVRKSVHELADAAGVSVASVSRLAKRLGCPDFKTFKIELARGTALPATAVHENIAAGDSDADIVRKIFGGSIEGIEETLKLNDPETLSEAARVIAGCRSLIFTGIGSSSCLALDSAMRFRHIGINSHAYSSHFESRMACRRAVEGDVVAGISHSGRSLDTVKCLKFAAENGAVTLGVSNYPMSPLQKVSSIFLCTAFRENKVRAAAISSRVSQICLLDALYALTAKYADSLPEIDKENRRIDEEFRIPEKEKSR